LICDIFCEGHRKKHLQKRRDNINTTVNFDENMDCFLACCSLRARVLLFGNGEGVIAQSRADLFAGEEHRGVGHRQQIIQLFRETRTPLYCYLVSLGAQPDRAEDLIQEAFVRLNKQFEIGIRIDNPRAWLFRVVHNLSISMHRVERRWRGEATISSEKPDWHAHTDPRPNPEELYLKRERMKQLEAGLARLTEQQRQCIYLRAEGLRYREIGVVLGINISSVAEHIQRAIVRLTGEFHA
jgi:RNA polymerase sigma-70 factor (ECF subfamily)